jgi:hypothetical protein
MSTVPNEPRSSWLPPVGSWQYYALLSAVAIFVLGPLGGVTAAYMNFSLGFFVGGQVLAGILGSAVTYGYGSEGKHGANYMQTMAASVAGMSGMAVLVQAMVWLGLPSPPAWQLVLYFLTIGMFGVGVGMLYTPMLVDRMQLTFPSGFAVANILRALTDAKLLRASIGKLGSGTGIGFLAGLGANYLAPLGALGISSSTIGAGMVVGARIAIPGMVVGLIGEMLVPWLVTIGALEEGEPFRKIGFIAALGTILGAAIVDMALLAYRMIGEFGKPKAAVAPGDEWKQTNTLGLVAWVVVWGAALVGVAVGVLHLPIVYVLVAVGLVFLFLVINGISTGISDSNPISSAFVLTVFLLAFMGLTDPATGLMCASILLIATSIGVDMQQDRSTGWRLGTNRTIQFRFQVAGVLMGAILSVGFAKVFMSAYPALEVNQYAHAAEEHAAEQAVADAQTDAAAASAAHVTAAAEKSAAAGDSARRAEQLLKEIQADPGKAAELAPKALLEAQVAAVQAGAASSEARSAQAPPPAGPTKEELEAKEARDQELKRWQSAMTYKFVGALSTLAPIDPEALKSDDPAVREPAEKQVQKRAITMNALWLGIAIGLVTEVLRKLIKGWQVWKDFATGSKIGFATDFVLDAVLLPSPYASSFGGFVDFVTTVWFAAGGVLTSFAQTVEDEVLRPYKGAGGSPGEGEVVPEDMSTTALVGGGLIAGESLAMLAIGIAGLLGALLAS